LGIHSVSRVEPARHEFHSVRVDDDDDDCVREASVGAGPDQSSNNAIRSLLQTDDDEQWTAERVEPARYEFHSVRVRVDDNDDNWLLRSRTCDASVGTADPHVALGILECVVEAAPGTVGWYRAKSLEGAETISGT
jgi:hypothetical protein